MKVAHDDLHVLTGSYVLDAVSDPERAGVRAPPAALPHLRGRGPRAARDRGPPGHGLRRRRAGRIEQRVLAATYQTRRLAPASGVRLSRLQAARERRRTGAAPRRFPRRLAIAAAAASVAAAAGLGVTQLSARQQLDSARSSAAAIARVVTASDARVETARTSAGGSVTVVTSAALHEAVVSATGMPPLSSGRVYQVWVMSPSGARSAGLIPAGQDRAGQVRAGQVRASSLLASAVRPGDRIGITVEPAGGTKRPTTTPVAVLPGPA